MTNVSTVLVMQIGGMQPTFESFKNGCSV